MSWLDRLARRTAQHGATADAPTRRDANRPATPNADKTRRDFLKKAGIVGGLAWTAPVLQSVIVPAAAASNNGAVLGQPCDQPGLDCSDGSVCGPSGICGGVSAICTSDFGCVYGNCHAGICGSSGATCKHDSGCVHGNCKGKVCGAPGATCSSNSYCQYANCGPPDKNGDMVCGSKGATCSHDTQCKGQLICVSGVCGT